MINLEKTQETFMLGFTVLFATSKTDMPLPKEQVWREEGVWSLWKQGVAHFGINISKQFNLYYA